MSKNLTSSEKPNQLLAYWAVAAISFFWGTTWLPSKVAVEYLPPLQLSGTRQIIAGTLFMSYFALKGYKMPTWQQLRRLIVLSFFFLVVSNGLTVWSLKYMPSGVASIIGSIVPLWIALIGTVFLKQKINRVVLSGLLLGFGGIVLVFTPEIIDLLETEKLTEQQGSFGIGLILAIIATISWSIGTIYNAKPDKSLNPFYSLGWQMLLSGFLLLIFSSLVEKTVPFTQIHPTAWKMIAYLVTIGSIITFIAYIYALRNLPTAQVAIYAYINPIIAVLLGWLLVGERLNAWLLGGGAITLVGVYLVNRGYRKE
jgi:drug/metabolite transporter (DMT)-like permease